MSFKTPSIIKDSFSKPDAVAFYRNANREGLFAPEKVAFERYLKPGRCLDIGCGAGREAIPLAQSGLEVTAIDFVEENVVLAKKEAAIAGANIHFVVGDCRELMFKEKSFDNVIMTNTVVQFLSKRERQKVFADVKRLLKDHGILIIYTDNRFVSYDFPYSSARFVKTLWGLERNLFHSEKSPLRNTALAKKLSGPKPENRLFLMLDALSTSFFAFFVDKKRAFLKNLLGNFYRGSEPYERRLSTGIPMPSLRKKPYYFYRLPELQDEIEGCGMRLIDHRSDWELVFADDLPAFFRDRAPISYYFIENIPQETTAVRERISDVIPLLKNAMVQKKELVFQILSDSMRPFFFAGDKLHARAVAPQNLRRGDIIIFESGSELFAHRIIGFPDSRSILTKGDDSQCADKPISHEAVIARVSKAAAGRNVISLEGFLWQITNHVLAAFSAGEEKNRAFFIRISARMTKMFFFLANPLLWRFALRGKDEQLLQKEIILRLSEKDFSEENEMAAMRLLRECRHWRFFLPLVLYNNVGPLVHKNLEGIKTHLVPSWVRETLRKHYEETSRETHSIYKDLNSLLCEFQKNHIPAIVLKGAAISKQLYENVSLRPMEDIDILVKESDWPSICESLEKTGFKNKEGLDLLKLEQNSPVAMNRHVAYENAAGTKLEFKFRLFLLDFPNANPKAYWTEALPENIAGVEALTLSREDQFLYLASRMANMGFRYLLWFVDLKEFLKYHRNLDWESVFSKAKERKVTLPLYYTLRTLKENLFVEEVPEAILRKLEPPPWLHRALDIIFDFRAMGFRYPQKIEFRRPIIQICIFFSKFDGNLGSLAKCFRHAFCTLFPPPRYLAARYHLKKWQALSGLGYLRRFGIKITG